MARFLFVSWAGGGNEPPALGIAQELQQRGHDVAFTGQDLGKGTAGFTGQRFRFTPLVRGSAAWDAAPPDHRRVTAVMVSAAHLRDLPDVVAREQPDALLVDCLLFGALAAAEGLGLPTAVLVHSPPGATAPPAGPREQSVLGPVNEVRRSAGLPAVPRLWDTWACFLSLCVTIPELDPLAADVPPSFEYVGPVFPRVPPSGWRLPWPAADPRPLVLGSFSTTAGQDQTSRIRLTLDALAGRNYRVLVTTGLADVAGLPVPANAVLVRHVPHGEVLPHAAAVVTHAGHGTVAAALAHACRWSACRTQDGTSPP
jgi:UDP:flavonoid glycosyltransferase YjiC (YdhE family)